MARRLLIVLLPLAAWTIVANSTSAQTQVTANQGAPGKQGAWPVVITLLADGGAQAQPVQLVGQPIEVQIVALDDGGTPTIAVTGLGNAPVSIEGDVRQIGTWVVTGIVELGPSTTAELTTLPQCTESRGSGFALTVGTLRRARPYLTDGGVDPDFTRWTELLIVNSDEKETLRCAKGFLDAGTPPSCATTTWSGTTIFPGGGFRKLSTTELEEVWCIACGTGATLTEVTAGECVHP